MSEPTVEILTVDQIRQRRQECVAKISGEGYTLSAARWSNRYHGVPASVWALLHRIDGYDYLLADGDE